MIERGTGRTSPERGITRASSTERGRGAADRLAPAADRTAPLPPVIPSIVLFAHRERARAILRDAFPRRRVRVLAARTVAEFTEALRQTLVDGVVIDLGAPGDETWRAASQARELPMIPFFAVLPLRASEGPVVARCASLEFAELLVEGMDDACVRDLMSPRLYTTRFAAALDEPPPALGLETRLQRSAWRYVIAHAGRAVRTAQLADSIGMTREHLSRTFASHGAPNLKRVIDLVRLISAAELAKNPGYDTRDVARILGFASSSHLSTTAQRVIGTRPASLARLRTVDLVARFGKGRTRSRS